jgi:hypothetical protein
MCQSSCFLCCWFLENEEKVRIAEVIKKYLYFLGLMKKIGRCIVVCFHPVGKNEIKYSRCFSSPVDAPSRNLNFQSDGLNLRRFLFFFDFENKVLKTDQLRKKQIVLES